MPVTEAMPKAEELALKALELDSTLAEAHALLGDVGRRYRDWNRAEREYKLAIELDPNSSEGPYGYALLMSMLGRHDEAISFNKRAQQLDPLNPAVRTSGGAILRMARRYDEAIEQCQAALDMEQDYQAAYRILARVYENNASYQEAAVARQKELTLQGATQEDLAGLSDAAALGKKAYARWWLNYDQERAEGGDYVPLRDFALAYGALGEMDQAFEWLEKAFEEYELGYLKVDPYYDPLRDDPRFQDLLRRMNLMP
jgi:serine/threonine-protein kinase